MIAFIAMLFLVPPRLFSSSTLSVINVICITLISVYGLNILTGYCGQISLGQAGFMAVGGYTTAILVHHAQMPFLLSLICGALLAAVIGTIVGIPCFRVKGFYLAIVTLAAFIIIDFIVRHSEIAGGHTGLFVGPVTIGEIVFDTQHKKYFFIMAITLIMTFFAINIKRTKVGRAFIAVRDNDLAAEVMGINTLYHKLLAFAICSFYAGLSGGLFVFHGFVVAPEYFMFMDNVKYLGMLIVGGMGSTLGAILGTSLLVGLDQASTLVAPAIVDVIPVLSRFVGFVVSLGPIIMGTLIILFLLFEPRGLAHRWELIKAYYRLWPFAY